MKILHKDGVTVVCKDDHPDTEGWERIDLPNGYSIAKIITIDGVEIEGTKSIAEIKTELEV